VDLWTTGLPPGSTGTATTTGTARPKWCCFQLTTGVIFDYQGAKISIQLVLFSIKKWCSFQLTKTVSTANGAEE
jgi:hypothetical protein